MLRFVIILFVFSYTLVSGQDNDYCIKREKTIRNLIGRNLTDLETQKYCRIDNKIAFWDSIISLPGFIEHNYPILRFEYLQGADDAVITEALIDFDQVRLFQGPQGKLVGEPEFQKLLKVFNIPKEYNKGQISLEEVQRRLMNNYIYDQINMGTNNFVNTVFAYLVGRTPTISELENGIAICEKYTGKQLFFQVGNNREDLLEILTSNDNYFEYQTKFWMEKIYFKEPNQKLIYEILNNVKNQLEDINLRNIILVILSSEV